MVKELFLCIPACVPFRVVRARYGCLCLCFGITRRIFRFVCAAYVVCWLGGEADGGLFSGGY